MTSILSKLKKLLRPSSSTPSSSTPAPILPPVVKSTAPKSVPKSVPAQVPTPVPTPVPTVVEASPVKTVKAVELVTTDLLFKIFPSTSRSTLAQFVAPINTYCSQHNINTRNRLASFISQVGHESAGFTALRENMNYSESGLLRVFPKYFTPAQAKQYARKPQAIGSRVYANRMGNGNEASGDGYKHRGFGAIQLTGKYNQSKFAKWVGKTLDEAIAYLQTPEGAILGAIWYWVENNINTLADGGEANVTKVTKKINGGTIGLADRLTKFKKAYTLLSHLD